MINVVSSSNGRASRFRSVRCIIVWSLLAGSITLANDAKLIEIQTEGHIHLALIHELQFGFNVKQSNGWEANVEIHHAGAMFRVDRVDVTGGTMAGKEREPLSFTSTYDGKRQQYRNNKLSSLRLEDGNDRAAYSIITPQTCAYRWLKKRGEYLHWDTIITSDLWEHRFADAVYIGTDHDEQGRSMEVVEFPQRVGMKNPCIYKVWFLVDVGYLPVRYVRRVEASGITSSEMNVTAFKTFILDGHKIAIPTVIEFEESGADGVSFIGTETITVDEATLKINHGISPKIFTLDETKATKVHDIDAHKTRIATLEAEYLVEEPERTRSPLILLVWGAVLISGSAGAVVAYRAMQKRKLA